MIKTVVLGSIVEKRYKLISNSATKKDEEGNEVTYYTDKPYIRTVGETKDWVEICSYEGAPQGITFYVSEDEKVFAEDTRFRADLNEYHIHTDKVVETIEVDKEKTEKALAKEIKKYNTVTIENDEKLKAYCDLHKLKYEETDPDELRKILPCDDIIGCVKTTPIDYSNEKLDFNTWFFGH